METEEGNVLIRWLIQIWSKA